MKTLIVYASHHGCTENAALSLKDSLEGDVEVFDIKKGVPQIDGVDTVIVGGSIHAGKIQKAMKGFLTKYQEQLAEKRLGLFLCCMYEGEQAKAQFEQAYPEVLRKNAVATGLFGGEFDFEKMSWLEKTIVKKVANVTESVSKVNDEAIVKFAEELSG